MASRQGSTTPLQLEARSAPYQDQPAQFVAASRARPWRQQWRASDDTPSCDTAGAPWRNAARRRLKRRTGDGRGAVTGRGQRPIVSHLLAERTSAQGVDTDRLRHPATSVAGTAPLSLGAASRGSHGAAAGQRQSRQGALGRSLIRPGEREEGGLGCEPAHRRALPSADHHRNARLGTKMVVDIYISVRR